MFCSLSVNEKFENPTKVMDMCGDNHEQKLRLQFQKRINSKKNIWEINDLLENCVWFFEKKMSIVQRRITQF